MAFGACFTCIKYSVFLFNFLLWLLGCSLIAIGAWQLSDDSAGRSLDQLTQAAASDGDDPLIVSYDQVGDSTVPTTIAYIFIAFGCVVVITAIIGCCGAIRENQPMLVTFFIALFVVFAVLLGVGIWAYVSKDRVNARTNKLYHLTNRKIKNAVRDYFTHRDSKRFMNTVQRKFKCCGAMEGEGDYRMDFTQPPPCDILYHSKPCIPVYFNYVVAHFENFMRDRLEAVCAVAFAFAACVILGMISVVLLFCAVRERRWSTNG